MQTSSLTKETQNMAWSVCSTMTELAYSSVVNTFLNKIVTIPTQCTKSGFTSSFHTRNIETYQNTHHNFKEEPAHCFRDILALSITQLIPLWAKDLLPTPPDSSSRSSLVPNAHTPHRLITTIGFSEANRERIEFLVLLQDTLAFVPESVSLWLHTTRRMSMHQPDVCSVKLPVMSNYDVCPVDN